jgi:hypothetical protein
MSLEDDKIDKLFRDASKNLSADFKEEYWEQFEAMLPEKKKRRFPFVWFTSGLSIIALSFLFYFGTDDKNAVQKQNVSTIATTENSRKQSTASDKKTDFIKSSQTTSAALAEEKILSKNKLSNNTIDSETNKHQTIKVTSEKAVEKYVREKIEPALGQSKEFNKSKIDIDDKLAIIGENKSILAVNKNSILLVDKMPFLRFPSFSQPQSILHTQQMPHAITKLKFYAEISGKLGQSIIINNSLGSNITKGFGLGAGFSYSTKNWNFTGGISTNFTSLDNLYVRERVKVYGLGITNYDNEIKFKQLYNIEIPFAAGIIKNKHLVQLGISPTYIVSAKIDYASSIGDNVIISASTYGYKKGLYNWGLKPSIGYMYSLTSSIQIGGSIQMQLFSLIENNRFEGVQTRNPISGQFYIRKSIFIK